MANDLDFDRRNQLRLFDTEEWYHNSEGSFSMSSGRFKPKSDVQSAPAWHGNLTGEPKDRKGK